MAHRTLAQIAAAKPYPDFAPWWPLGEPFVAFMATAIGEQWAALHPDPQQPADVATYLTEYLQVVYDQAPRADLLTDFHQRQNLGNFQSGEFDALSYAFYRSAFTHLAGQIAAGEQLAQARRHFTQRVGKRFFDQLADHLALRLPADLTTTEHFDQATAAIAQVGAFLQREGYLRDHFAFRFDVQVTHQGRVIHQQAAAVIPTLQANGVAYALYEMGYPIILPSAVYLYHTLGEAQHHSSRTIEELFARMGYRASETADFDPTGYPSDMVVELWEIR